MNRSKSIKRDLLKNRLYSILILLLAAIIAVLGILQKVSDSGQLLDRDNVATTDIVAVNDYYDKAANIEKATLARDSVNPIAVRINTAQVALYENIINFFNTTNQYREQVKLLSLTNPQYNMELSSIVYQYTSFLSSSGLEMPNSLAKDLLRDENETVYDSYKTNVRSQFSMLMEDYIYQENVVEYQNRFVEEVNKSVTDKNLMEDRKSVV